MLFIFAGIAQDLSFVNYSTRDGLSSSQVYQMFQDKNGDILFATDRGISKFDGYEFKTYSIEDGLTNTTVFRFFPQSNGDVWCSTINSSWFYFKNGTTNFQAYKLNPLIQEASLGGQADDIWIDGKGGMYFGFENLSDYLKINTRTETVEHPINKGSGAYDTINAVFVKTDDWFKYNVLNNRPEEWVANSTVILKQNREKLGFKKTEVINEHFLFSSGFHLLIKDKDTTEISLQFDSRILGIGKFDKHHFWVTYLDDGVKIFDMSGRQTQHWLDNISATNVFVDRNQGIWISTLTNGVYFAQSNKLKFHSEQANFILSISPGINNKPVVNTLTNNYQYDGASLIQLTKDVEGHGRKTLYDFQNKTYKSYIPTDQNVSNEKVKSIAAIIDFTENSDVPLLIGSPYSFLIQKGKFFHSHINTTRITAIEYAENGLLLGGYSGLMYFQLSDSSFNKVSQKGLQGRINDIKLKDGIHFIGTNSEGLVKYNRKKNSVIQITAENGLASNLVNEVYAETKSIVWVATNAGLDRVSFIGDEYTIQHFGIEDGLIDNDITDVYVHNGTIWIGTRTGLYSISKLDFETIIQPATLHLFWESVHSNNRELVAFKNLELEHDENNLELNFHSAFYGGKSRVQYRYIIAGSNDIWHDLKGRKIILNGLLPGSYRVILQANIDNSSWQQHQIELIFHVLPPFYQTWWFRSIIVFLIVFLIYLFFKFRVIIYNRSLVKEILRLMIRKLKPKTNSFVIQEQGKSHRINSSEVLFLKSEGNYLIIQLPDKKYIIRYKIGEYELLVPDKSEYLRVHKSFVARIDNMTGKNADTIYFGNSEVPIGKTYKKRLKELNI